MDWESLPIEFDYRYEYDSSGYLIYQGATEKLQINNTSANIWKIVYTTVDASGNIITRQTRENVAWTNRANIFITPT